MGSEIFRFMTIRPPQRVNYQELERDIVRVDDFSEPEPENPEDPEYRDLYWRLHNDLRMLRQASDRSGMVEAVKQFLGISNFNLDRVDRLASQIVRETQLPLIDLDRWISSQRKPIKLAELTQAVLDIFEVSPAEIVSDNSPYNYQGTRREISCFLTVSCIFQSDLLRFRPLAMRFMRILGLLERMANPNDNTLEIEGGIEKALRAHVLLPSDIFPLPSANLDNHKLEDKKQAEKKKLQENNFQRQYHRQKETRKSPPSQESWNSKK